ncbi:MAG: NAD(P)-binding protein, partial [Bacteroidetes bacterium]|nr:NAD(P)-binding protein [Bacteroidota bacterium]
MTNHITTYLLILLLLLAGCNNSVKENPKADYDVIVIGAGAAGMYAALHLDKNDINVKVLEASSTHGGRAQYNESFSNGFITLGPEEVYNSPNYPIPLRAKAMQAFKRWASEEDKDTTQMEVRGDSVFVENKFFAILPDSARTRIDIYADLYKWDSTLLHPFELGEEFYNPFYEDHRERWGDWPYRGQNNYDDMDFHVGLKNIVYMKDGKRVNALEDNSYHDALRAARKIYRYDGPDTTESAVLNMELGIEEGDIEWILIEDLFAAGTSASSLNRMYTSKYPEFD